MNFTDWISVAAPMAYLGWLVRDIKARREVRRVTTPTGPASKPADAKGQEPT